MFTRRRTVQTGLATLLSAAAPFNALAQTKPRVKVRYSEVVHSILYTPAYVALAKGFFDEAGLDVTMTTAQGGDKSLAIMVTNQADIGLIGPETAIYVQNSDSPTKIPIFCGLTATDGFMLVGLKRSTSSIGTCSRVKKYSASGRVARRCSILRRRCARTGSTRKKT